MLQHFFERRIRADNLCICKIYYCFMIQNGMDNALQKGSLKEESETQDQRSRRRKREIKQE